MTAKKRKLQLQQQLQQQLQRQLQAFGQPQMNADARGSIYAGAAPHSTSRDFL